MESASYSLITYSIILGSQTQERVLKGQSHFLLFSPFLGGQSSLLPSNPLRALTVLTNWLPQ
jgi:hypothetical protein